MGLQLAIRLNATDLPDNGIWFANSAAFTNYLNSLEGEGNLEPAANLKYVPSNYDDTLVAATVTIDEEDFVLVTKAMFDSLKAKLDTLDISYKNLRDALKAAGVITEAQ